MRDRGQTFVGEVRADGTVATEDRPGIAEHLDRLIGEMSIEERSEPGRVKDAKERTVRWYDRLHRAHRGGPLTRAQAEELESYLERVAPDAVARWNARQLGGELAALEGEIDLSGLSPSERALLRSRAEDLRTDLERSQRYRREHDDRLVAVTDLVRRGSAAWAERHLGRLEPFLGRHRWWL